MRAEHFNYINFSDESKFIRTETGRIELKEYINDLTFYASLNNLSQAEYSIGDKVGLTGTNSYFELGGPFSNNCLILKDYLTYNNTNFDGLADEGSISFKYKANFDNGYAYQKFTTTSITITGITSTGLYGVRAIVQDFNLTDVYVDVSVTIEYDTIALTDLNTLLAAQVALTEINSSYYPDNRLRLYARNTGKKIELADLDGTLSLIDLLNGVEDPIIPNGPTVGTEILTLANGNNLNKISFTHMTDSKINIKMYDSAGTLAIDRITEKTWNNVSYEWNTFEFSWNIDIAQMFINGSLFDFFATGFTRSSTGLNFYGNTTDSYKLNEIIIKNVYGNNKSYEPSEIALQKYSNERPYIDIYFESGLENINDLNLDCYENCHFSVKINNTWYYYLAGSWRPGDGTFATSVSASVMETKFGELYFEDTYELIIRVFFESNGTENCWIDKIELVSQENTDVSAVITGSAILTNGIDLSTNKYVKVVTNSGTTILDVSAGAVNPASVSLEEIKYAFSNVDGIGNVYDDGNGHLVLESSDVGAEASLSVLDADSGSATSLIFGFSKSDTGEEAFVFDNYTDLFRKVRVSLGYPIVPVEVTDEQLQVLLEEAIYEYNRWKNFDENFVISTLIGNGADGYEIPSIIGGRKNLIEIIFKPKNTMAMLQNQDQVASNLYLQMILNQYGNALSNEFLFDYHLAISMEKDINLILGTEIRWQILNNKLYIAPIPSDEVVVGIKYRRPMSIDEITNNTTLLKYLIAKTKILLGTIRGTFGSTIPGGGENIQLNAADLISQGTAELEAIKESWKKETEPLFIEIG